MRAKDLINPFKWWMFAKGMWLGRRMRNANSLELLSDALQDQPGTSLAYRTQVMQRAETCEACLINGKCFYCGCKTPELFLNREDKCSQGKWGPMEDDIIWEIKHQSTNQVK